MSKQQERKAEPIDVLSVAEDEQKRIAMAHAMLENQMRKREAECGVEINNAIMEILARHKCFARFIEIREIDPRPDSREEESAKVRTRIWIQPVALDRIKQQGG